MFPTQPQHKSIYSVSKLNRLARTILEGEIGTIWLTGEISNFVHASSGHWYFSIKDNKAQIRAAMFKNANRQVKPMPKQGDKVLVRATLSLYEPRGDYQLIVSHIEPEGAGALKQAFEKLKQQLSEEGLFDQQNKQSLPTSIKTVGIITSTTGAALQDILTTLARRSPTTEIVVYPSMVQGEEAPAQLIAALQKAQQHNQVEVIIIGRGGGSAEDLHGFNDEGLARQIAAMTLPIVSAVGHETDVTICDFVADLRAATPTAAAELVSRDQSQLCTALKAYADRLKKVTWEQLNHARLTLHHLNQRLRQQDPIRQYQLDAQKLDNLSQRLTSAIQRQRTHKLHELNKQALKFSRHSPLNQLNEAKSSHRQLSAKFHNAMSAQLQSKKQHFSRLVQLLHAVSPLASMSRGYTMSFRDDQLVTKAAKLQSNDILTTEFSDGKVTSRIETIRLKDK
jgi:exodeoxyribonuclease VII large subunit